MPQYEPFETVLKGTLKGRKGVFSSLNQFPIESARIMLSTNDLQLRKNVRINQIPAECVLRLTSKTETPIASLRGFLPVF